MTNIIQFTKCNPSITYSRKFYTFAYVHANQTQFIPNAYVFLSRTLLSAPTAYQHHLLRIYYRLSMHFFFLPLNIFFCPFSSLVMHRVHQGLSVAYPAGSIIIFLSREIWRWGIRIICHFTATSKKGSTWVVGDIKGVSLSAI